jgi:hypothetical protein
LERLNGILVHMIFILIAFGGLISAAGTIPYILETIKGNTRPKVVTWLTWSLLTGLAGFAALADGQPGSALFALLGTLATGSVVAAGLRYGDRSFGVIDIACSLAVLAGLALWLIFKNPVIAVWIAIAVDSVGFVPTFIHAWHKPEEETASAFALIGFGGAITVAATLASGAMSVTALGYPCYVALSMALCTAVVLLRTPRQFNYSRQSLLRTATYAHRSLR